MAANFIQSVFLKPWFKLGVCLMAVAGLFWFTINLWVERKLPFIESSISIALHHPVTIEKAHYDFFRGFLFEGVEVRKNIRSSAPIRIERVQAVPTFFIAPKPAVRIEKIVFEHPRLLLRGKSEDFFKASTHLRNFPLHAANIGFLAVEVKLSSFEVREGRVSLLLVESKNTWRQDFEGVRFFVGRNWFQKNLASLNGHIAGKPDASFRIECEMKNSSQHAFDSNIRMNFHQFTTAYLNPHLGNRFKLPDKDLTASMKFKIRDGRRIEAKGRIRLPEMRAKRWIIEDLLDHAPEVSYFLRGVWDKDHGEFTSVSLKSGKVEVKGKGDIRLSTQDGYYHFSLLSSQIPFSKFKGLLALLKPDSGHVQLHFELEGNTKHFDPVLDMVFRDCALHAEDSNLTVMKLDGRLRLSEKSIEADEIWAFVNNLPIRLDGRLLTGVRPSFRLELSTYPGQLPELRKKNPLNASMEISGIYRKEGWSGHLRFRKDDLQAKSSVQNIWTASFRNMIPMGRARQNAWGTLWRGMQWKCRFLNLRQQISGTAEETKKFSLTHLKFLVTADENRFQFRLTDSEFCEGKLTVKGRVDLHRLFWEFNVSVINADVKRVFRYLNKPYPVTGRLNLKGSWMGLKNNISLVMRFKLSDGLIGPSPVFLHWAEQTGIDALKCIGFHSFYGEAFYKNSIWEIRELKLDGDQAKMSANLKLRSKMISGLLSVKFPAEAIRDSSDLKWLLRFVHGGEWVDFDFKIAGNLAHPRVEWQGGEFKKKVSSALAPWMKAEFDRQVEKKLSEGAMAIS